METLIKILQVILSLSLLVIIHEAGHFMFAKIFHCRVEKFYLFFDWKFSVLKYKRGETEFGIGWIPFGGYVKIAGMIDESMDKEQLAAPMQPWEFRAKPAWQRFFIIIGGVLMNVVLAIVIYAGISCVWGEQYISTTDVHNGYSYSSLAHEAGFIDGDQILSIDGNMPENVSLITYEMALAKDRNILVNRNGSEVSVTISDTIIKKMLKDPTFVQLRIPFVIDSVQNGMGAERASLQKGDSLVSVNGHEMVYMDQFKSEFAKNCNDTISLGFIRNGELQCKDVFVNEHGTIGVFVGNSLLDYYPVTTKSYNFLEAIPHGFKRGIKEIGDYLSQLRLIVSPETETYKEVGGFIAIGKIFPGEWDWYRFWNISALLSIMLAVINILPIPMLDGGHLVFIIWEMITRKAPSEKVMEVAQYIGLFIVLALVILANGNDILKLFLK